MRRPSLMFFLFVRNQTAVRILVTGRTPLCACFKSTFTFWVKNPMKNKTIIEVYGYKR
jgi:hypothetical protein